MHFRRAVCLSLTMLAACSSEPERRPPSALPIPLDRPLDGTSRDISAARTAALIEAALVEVKAADLRRCLVEFLGDPPARFRSPAHSGWLVVASALPAEGPVFAARHEAAPGLNARPDHDWQDRITYRALLRSANPVDASVACLSCVFDYDAGRVTYRHAYALETCQHAGPGERALVAVLPLP